VGSRARPSALTRAALAAKAAWATGCSWWHPVQHVRVQKEMTWRCAPELARADLPGYQAVRIRFAQDPRYGEVVFAKGLCDQLTSAARPSTGSTSFFEPHDPAQPKGRHPLDTLFK